VGPHIAGQATSHSWGSEETSEPHRTSLILALTRKKDDAEDARIARLLALDRHTRLRPVIPHGELAAELRAIARDDERAARAQRRLGNRLRRDLLSTFPAALAIAGDNLGAPTMLRLLERWPTRDQLASASRHQLVAFARAGRHGWPDRIA
jgi:hypothetical protein